MRFEDIGIVRERWAVFKNRDSVVRTEKHAGTEGKVLDGLKDNSKNVCE
jgi:hypothetical protein